MLNRAADIAAEPAEALLVIVPAGNSGRDRLSSTTPVAGLPLVRRLALAGTRAGVERILVHELSVDGALAGIRTDRLTATAPGPRVDRRLILLPSNVLPRTDWLRGLLEAPVQRDTLYVDASMTAVIETGQPERILAAASRCRNAGEVVAALRASFGEADWPFDPAGRFALAGPGDVRRAETWLLRGLIKPSEGFMSRHVERRISLALTRRLVATRMTPNAMTLISVAIGLLGAPCFLSPDPWIQLAGALLFLAHSILDGCDGELARLKFLESRRGALLDFWGDNIVHVAVFSCMAIGWSRSQAAAWPLLVGLVAIAATLGAAVALSGRSPARPGPERRSSWAARLTDALANRDFIYLIVLLSLAGKAWWFLVLVAGGTPIFLLLVSAGRRGENA